MEELVEKKEDGIDNSVDRIGLASKTIEPIVIKTITPILTSISSKGVLIGDVANVAMVRKFIIDIGKAMQDSKYEKTIDGMVRSFKEISEVNIELQKVLNNLTVKLKNVNQFVDSFMTAYKNTLLGTGFAAQVVDPVSSILLKGIASAASMDSVLKSVKDYLINPTTGSHRMEIYSTQITRDALYQFDGSMNQRIADEFGLDAYLYVGSIKPGVKRKKGKKKGKRKSDSRPQCIKWVAMGELKVSELDTEIKWAYSNGSGMIPGTTTDNFSVYRGGYNCRHQAIPTKSTKVVSKTETE